MNYIKQLQNDKKVMQAQITAFEDGLAELRRYLELPKFHVDTTVQVKDIFLRLDEVKYDVGDKANDQANLNYHEDNANRFGFTLV
jgi:hypothetical protein